MMDSTDNEVLDIPDFLRNQENLRKERMAAMSDLNSDIIVLSAKMMSICSKEKCHPDEIEDCVYCHAEEIKQLCIKSDEAREYWKKRIFPSRRSGGGNDRQD